MRAPWFEIRDNLYFATSDCLDLLIQDQNLQIYFYVLKTVRYLQFQTKKGFL